MATEKDVVKAQNAAAQAATQARNEQQALDYFNAMDNFYLRQYSDEVNKELSDKIKEDQFKDALKISDMQKDAQLRAFDLSEERYQEQLSINQAEFERAQAGINRQFDSTVRSFEDQIDDQERAFSQQQDRAAFDQDRINRQRDQIQSQFDIAGRENALSMARARDQLNQRASIRSAESSRQSELLAQDRADITTQQNEINNIRAQANLLRQNRESAADLEEARAELNRDSQLANIAFQKQGQRIESLVQRGQIKAMGRQGVSAARSLQTTMALNGLNIARLTNQAFFANQEFSNTQSSIANRRTAIGIEDQISKEREASALAQLTTRGQRLTTQDRYQTAVRDAQAAGDATEQSRLNTQESLLADIAKSRFDFDTADADQRLDEISYAIGVSKEQLTMNKERLGASLAAATASIDDQLLALDQAKYKADYNAHAARMLPPEFAPDAKAPYDVPLPKYIEPRPGAAPAPAYQAQYVAPQQPSGFSQALAIGGAALGIAAVPFTLGASLGASAAATAGLTGAAASAAPAGLGLGMSVGTASAIGLGLTGSASAASQAAGLMYRY